MRTIILGSLILTLFSGIPEATGPGAVDVTIVGRVVDDATGGALPSAQIIIPELNLSTLTNATGDYRLTLSTESLTATRAHLVARSPGYAEASRELAVATDLAAGRLTVDFRLELAWDSLDEVVGGNASTSQRRPLGTPAGRTAGIVLPAAEAASRMTQTAGFRPGWNREQYGHIEENAWKAVGPNPLSTFSIDVDRASYSNVRRFLRNGTLPPIDAVRIEEMVNYFDYDYGLPEGDHPLAVTTEVGRAPWRENHLLFRIGLASPAIETRDLPPSNLVFLLDVSGSMNSPDKLPLVKQSLRLLVEQLRTEDRVALVVYAGAAGLVLESTSGSEQERILDAIENLEAGGSTAGGAGLRLAYRVAEENFLEGGNNRVILATDGDFNVGESSDSAMIRLIESMRGQGTFLTVLGFGTGNLQAEKMQGLAQTGNGNYGYVDSLQEARKILVGEMGATLVTVAQDVKLQVEFNPAEVAAYRLIGYENRLLAAEDFNNDEKDAGDLGAGHRVTALYELIPVGADTEVEVPGIDPLRYGTPSGLSSRATDGELALVRVRYKEPRAESSRLMEHPVRSVTRSPSRDLRFASAVAGFGMILRDSEHRGALTVRDVLSLAREGRGRDPEGYRAGFIEMVGQYQELVADR